MKIKDGFLLRQVAGQTVVLPCGDDLDLNMMINLNDTGAFLWQQLQNETDEAALVAALLAEYDVDEQTARDAVAHLFGRNYYNRSFVTRLGFNPPMYPHDRRSAADDVYGPWPGYVVGGGHTATDWIDNQDSYSHNEVAINWQAGLVFALAYCL